MTPSWPTRSAFNAKDGAKRQLLSPLPLQDIEGAATNATYIITVDRYLTTLDAARGTSAFIVMCFAGLPSMSKPVKPHSERLMPYE